MTSPRIDDARRPRANQTHQTRTAIDDRKRPLPFSDTVGKGTTLLPVSNDKRCSDCSQQQSPSRGEGTIEKQIPCCVFSLNLIFPSRRAFTAGVVLGTAFGVGGTALLGKTVIGAAPLVWGVWRVRRYVREKRRTGKIDPGGEDARAGRAGIFEGVWKDAGRGKKEGGRR